MSQNALMVGAILVTTALAPSATANPNAGMMVVVPFDNAQVTVQLIDASAAYTGNLRFIGSGDQNAILITVPSTDGDTAPGQSLFLNHDQPQDSGDILQGTFNAGDVLHFAYDILSPLNAVDLLRTDVANEQTQFAFDAASGELRVEDLRLDSGWSDEDYNDLIAHVQFTQVPAPGTAVVAVAGLLMAGARRRRSGSK